MARRLGRLICSVAMLAIVVALIASCQAIDGISGSLPAESATEHVSQLQAHPTAGAQVRDAASGTPTISRDVPAMSTIGASATAAVRSDGRPQLSIPEIVELVRPAIVHIATEAASRDTVGRPVPAAGVATGFVIDAGGLIITNNHVVANAQNIVVTMAEGIAHDASVVGRDPQTDLAVLRVGVTGLTPVTLGQSADLRVGESVVAIGHALDLPGGPTVTAGVVSAVDRTITNVGSQRMTLSDLIQTDASINPGNSGGPLLNRYGEVVGVNAAGSGFTTGIGFAIAIDGARPVIDELIESGQVVRGFLGVGSATITRGIAHQFELPVNQGILITHVTTDSPALQAGLRRGDILVAINDVPVPDVGVLHRVLAQYAPGREVTVRFIRPDDTNQPRETRVALGRRPDQ